MMKLVSRRLTRGFTLIEILVVVNIIALLMLLLTGVLPRIGARVKAGRAAQCDHSRRIVEEAEAFYVQQHDGEHSASLEALAKEGYLTAPPKCSSGGEYVWLNDAQEPTLGCSLHYAGEDTTTSTGLDTADSLEESKSDPKKQVIDTPSIKIKESNPKEEKVSKFK